MSYVVDSIDGPVFVGLFQMRDTHGIPLESVMQWCREDGLLFSVPHFIRDAFDAGWKAAKIRACLRDAWVNLGIGTRAVDELVVAADLFINAKGRGTP